MLIAIRVRVGFEIQSQLGFDILSRYNRVSVTVALTVTFVVKVMGTGLLLRLGLRLGLGIRLGLWRT